MPPGPTCRFGSDFIKGVWQALATGFVYRSGNADLDVLLSRGGMDSMLNTVWLIMAALAFGSVMHHAGLLDRVVAPVARLARSTVSLVTAVLVAAIGINIVAADQYLAVVLPGRTFKEEFVRRGLPLHVLSRSLGDGGIVTAPLVPWNSCGAFMAATLGVTTLHMLPFCFYNLFSPVIAIVVAVLIGRKAAPAASAASTAGE